MLRARAILHRPGSCLKNSYPLRCCACMARSGTPPVKRRPGQWAIRLSGTLPEQSALCPSSGAAVSPVRVPLSPCRRRTAPGCRWRVLARRGCCCKASRRRVCADGRDGRRASASCEHLRCRTGAVHHAVGLRLLLGHLYTLSHQRFMPSKLFKKKKTSVRKLLGRLPSVGCKFVPFLDAVLQTHNFSGLSHTARSTG